ncbi:MAG TPA: hypothetical protein VIB47_05745, partial [Dehalococcoidia bacterium]
MPICPHASALSPAIRCTHRFAALGEDVMADAGVEVKGPVEGRFSEVLTPEALDFLAALHRRFNATRLELLARRAERQKRFDAGEN